MYTFENYRDMVKKSYLASCGDKERTKASKYFDSEEAQDVIRENYESDIKKLKNKEITEKVFCNGCVDGVAYCLYLMME